MRSAFILGLHLCCLSAAVAAADAPPREPTTIAECHELRGGARLDCYDKVTGYKAKAVTEAAAEAKPGEKVIEPVDGILGEFWGLDKAGRDNQFEIKQYHQNYLVYYQTTPFNFDPTTPPDRVYGDQPSTEPRGVKFQISAKTRVLGRDDNAFGLWLAYSQRSWWQVLDGRNSRPFRETDFEPEAILSFRPELFGWSNDRNAVAWRLLNVGFIHQSNGRSGNASRSWNRAYVEAGLERDFSEDNQLAVLARAWTRINDGSADDNPGITDYVGYAQLQALWRYRNHFVTGTVRGNLGTGKGGAELTWAMPVCWPFVCVRPEEAQRYFPIKFYLQLSTGYGESLLDYNFRQTTFGAGVMLNDRR